jgi:hypothetical protein
MMYWLIQVAQIVSPNDLNIPKGDFTSSTTASALRLFFGVVGAVAVLIITIGGFRYVISQGNPQETAKAKNAIMYAVVGLVICVAAFGIIEYVIPRL